MESKLNPETKATQSLKVKKIGIAPTTERVRSTPKSKLIDVDIYEKMEKELAELREAVSTQLKAIADKDNLIASLTQRVQIATAIETTLNNYIVSLETTKVDIKKRLIDIQDEHGVLRGKESFIVETLNMFENTKKILNALRGNDKGDEKV